MNFFSDETRRDPYPAYEQVRTHSPVTYLAAADLWMVFDYDGVKRVLFDHEAFSSAMSTAGRSAPEWIIFFDPPRHSKLRGLISRAFTPGVVAGLEPRIRELSRGLLEGMAGRDEVDLAATYSTPLPAMVIAEMIGIPAVDWPLFKRWSDAIVQLSFFVTGSVDAKAAGAGFRAAAAEMSAYVPEMIARRRSSPKDDLLTGLAQAEVDGERLSDQEIIAFLQLLLVGGQETTANLINNAILCFLENPDQLARLRAQPELLPAAIEETLRYRSPLQWALRATRRAVDLGGQTIPEGKLVLAVMGSANRDTRVFPAADRFDIARVPNPHVAFGHGIHFCLGAALARVEARIALSDLLARWTSFEPAGAQPWEPRKALHVLGPEKLLLRVTESPAAHV